MKRLYLALGVIVLGCGIAFGADQGRRPSPMLRFDTGDDLMGECTDVSTPERSAYCLGYVAGAADMFEFARWANSQTPCVPVNAITLSQLTALVVEELRHRPEARDAPAAYHVATTMVITYCPAYQG